LQIYVMLSTARSIAISFPFHFNSITMGDDGTQQHQGTTEGTTVETTEDTNEETTEKSTDETTAGTTEQTTEGTTERSTEGTAGTTEPTHQPCTGWCGEAHRNVILLSTEAFMMDMKNTANVLPPKFPLCGSFRTREGYNKLEICTSVAADGESVDLKIRSKECHLEVPKGKISRKLCSSCGPLDESVKQIRHQSHRKAINSDSNLH
jgi:hypothetical protein